jgi:holo-[acyl-carrier protein] synthase
VIFGIGVDVLEAQRAHETYRRFGERFVERLLLPAERVQFERTQRKERFLAMRFAAKEAVVKAMGTGFAHGMWIRDVGVVQNAWGKPEVVFSARGERVRRRLGIGEGHVTLSDEGGFIVAVAVLLRAARKAVRRAPGRKAGGRKAGGRKAGGRKAAAGAAVRKGARKPVRRR